MVIVPDTPEPSFANARTRIVPESIGVIKPDAEIVPPPSRPLTNSPPGQPNAVTLSHPIIQLID